MRRFLARGRTRGDDCLGNRIILGKVTGANGELSSVDVSIYGNNIFFDEEE